MKFSYPGLSDNAVSESRKIYGANVVTTQEAEGFFDKLRTNLKDPIIVILIVALAVTVFLAAMGFAPWYEGLGIAFAVVMATLIATWSEYSNENEFQRLLEEASKVKVKVFRNSTLVEILIDDLVVNDLVLLQPGDTVPADGYLLTGEIELNESALTGESETVKKTGGADEKHSEAEEKYEMSRAALVVDGDGGDSVGPSFLDCHASSLLGDHETEAPVAVDDGGAGGFFDDLKRSSGDDVADVDALDVSWCLYDPVGVVARKVGFDQMPRHDLGFVFRSALGAVDVVGNFMQIFGRKNGHVSTSAESDPSLVGSLGFVHRTAAGCVRSTAT